MQPGRLRVYLRLAKRTSVCLICIRRRVGQRIGSGFYFLNSAIGDAAGAPGNGMGADFNSAFCDFAGWIDKPCRNRLAFKHQFWGIDRGHIAHFACRRKRRSSHMIGPQNGFVAFSVLRSMFAADFQETPKTENNITSSSP